MAEVKTLPLTAKEVSSNASVIDIPRTSEKLPGTTIDFLYVSHAPADAREVADRMKDADFLLVETVGTPRDLRKKLEDLYNDLLEKGPVEKKKDKAFAELNLDNFLDLFVFRSVGSGKRVKLVDVPLEDPRLKAMDAGWRSGEEVKSLMQKGQIEDAFEKFHLYVDSIVQASRLREDFVFNEIADLLPDLKGIKNVMVVQGAAHTPVHHRFVRTFPEIQTGLNFEPRDLRYGGFSTLARKRLLFPERKISEAEYRRAFIEDRIFSAGAFERETVMTTWGWKSKEQIRFARELSLKLTDEEIREVFDQFSSQYEVFQEEEKKAGGLYDRVRDKLLEWGKPGVFLKLTVRALTAKWAEQKGVSRPED